MKLLFFPLAGGVAQSVRARGSYPRRRWFESSHRHHSSYRNLPNTIHKCKKTNPMRRLALRFVQGLRPSCPDKSGNRADIILCLLRTFKIAIPQTLFFFGIISIRLHSYFHVFHRAVLRKFYHLWNQNSFLNDPILLITNHLPLLPYPFKRLLFCFLVNGNLF